MNKVYPNSVMPLDPGIGQTPGVTSNRPAGRGDKTVGGSFQDLLQELVNTPTGPRTGSTGTEGLKFSAHAQQKLASRQIDLGRDAMQRLDQAVARAAEKGAKDALMLMPGVSRGEDLAFVVSVTNRTVITAMDGEHITENVFTNIDSAMVVT
jgi:flagellar operon protein